MTSQFELIFIFASVIIGMLAAGYLYISTNIFEHLGSIQRPLRWVAVGVILIAISVLLAAFISYEEQQGLQLYFYDMPLQAFFYIIHGVGSLSILFGARRFTHHPKSEVVDVSLQG